MEKPPSSFLTTGDAITALAERTAYVDQLVTGQVHRLPSQGFSLLAVGGYGRRHLFPYSDIDLLLLFESNRFALANKEAISGFLQTLWDAGLRVSQSVRAPAECLEVHDLNAELNVSLLDQRYLAGDRALYADLARRLPKFLQSNREPLVKTSPTSPASATPSSPGPSITWSPTSRRRPAASVTSSSSAGSTSFATAQLPISRPSSSTPSATSRGSAASCT